MLKELAQIVVAALVLGGLSFFLYWLLPDSAAINISNQGVFNDAFIL